MKCSVKKRGKKWRVVDPTGALVRQNGMPVDGGGFRDKGAAERLRDQLKAKKET